MTKTCGECKYFVPSEYLDVCTVNCDTKRTDSPAQFCDYFKPKVITNGDKIIAGGMRELAKFINDNTSLCPPTKLLLNCSNKCEDCWFNWLNAPAESEENNG